MRSQSNLFMSPIGHSTARRGSVLLMVIATLALLAIIGVAYATLGRADRAASASLVRESRLDDQASQFADYLASVIGDNTFATYSQRTFGTGANEWKTRRAAVNIPGIDLFMVSSLAAATNGGYRFDPTGSYEGAWTGGGTDPRWTASPFLASSEPVLRPANNMMPGGGFRLITLRDTRTWAAITNVAPDGHAVNMANLRGNFRARPGTGNGEMSDGLSILNAAGVPTTAGTDPDVPADFFTNQIGGNRLPFDNLPPSDPDHVLNQWADANGDGLVDARWIELVDAFLDPNNPQWLLPQQGRMRMFLAARIEDLCGRVNVNTATDFTLDPGSFTVNASGNITDFYPAGLTPSDIDLRGILSVYDHHFLYQSQATQLGYNQLAPPLTAGSPSDYSAYTPDAGRNIGKAAYASLLHTINNGDLLPSDARRPAPSSAPELQFPQVGTGVNPNPLTPSARAVRYDEFGSDPFAARLMSGTTRAFRAPFGTADELDLRTFEGINNSEHFSRLEQATGARENAGFGPLRENRARALEMTGRVEASNAATDQALLQAFTDVRRLLTTLSGARPLIDNPLEDINPDQLSAREVRFDALPLISRLNGTGNASSTLLTVAQVQSLFDAYAAALVPYTHEDYFPDAWDPLSRSAFGLSYGGNAELATRIVAHLTANWLDAIDTERAAAGGRTYDTAQPSRLRLDLTDGSTLPQTFPPNQFEPTRIVNLPQERQPADPAQLRGARHLNIFGIEAQPFLVEAAWYGMFTDTPRNAVVQGDDDFSDNSTPNPIPPNDPILGPITINNSTRFGNPDFLFEVLAFQITNPFDRDLLLATAGKAEYYIEYANRFFALAEQTPVGDAIDNGPVILPAYATRVFYATNVRRQSDVTLRIRNAASAAPPLPPPPGGPVVGGTISLDYVQRWASAQFGSLPGNEPVRIPMVHRESLLPCPGEDLAFGSAQMTRIDLFGERTVLAGPNGAQQDPIQTAPTSTEQRKVVYLWRRNRTNATPNDPNGDIMLDRMRDPTVGPGTSTLYSRRPGGTDDIQRIGGTEAGDDTDSVTGNEEDNTGYSFTKWAAFRRATDNTAYARGSMPAWAMERKTQDFYPTPATLNNQADTATPVDMGDKPDYDGSQAERRDRLMELVTDQRTATILNTQIAAEADDKTGNQIGINRSGKAYSKIAVQVHLSGNGTNPQLFARSGDFLLPLAIGPSQNPALNGAHRVELLENQWMTLAEALALASDYYSPPATDPLHLLGHRDDAANPPVRPKVDRAGLVLTDYVPFFDANDNRVFDLNTDEPLGAGIPLALNIPEMFSTGERLPPSSVTPPVRYSPGGLRKMVHGVINANTAPRPVLQAVPMLTPTRDTDTTPLAWVQDTSVVGGAIFNPATDKWDIAATLTAYRDKSILWSRLYGAGNQSDEISFRDDADGNADEDGRTIATAIAGIRETPGFRGRGEILAANFRDAMGQVTRPEYSMFRQAAIPAALGQGSSRHKGLASTLIPAANGTGFVTDDIENDYAEQLLIANAAMNSLTVRSDVFCVWFVLHGYLPSDVENLGPNDPMIPSIARRYVMVVDRSNVAVRGDKPRIVMFQEVPLK